MTDEQKKLIREQLFLATDFQKKWNKYLKAFGKDIDELFCDDIEKKIRLSEGLEHLLNNRLSDAYHVIRHLESACVTNSDKQIFDRLIKLCLNEEEMARAKVGDWVKQSHGGYYQIIKRTFHALAHAAYLKMDIYMWVTVGKTLPKKHWQWQQMTR